MAASANRAIYQLTAAVDEIQPPIWRRLRVRENTTLPQLHRILQVAFGWEDYRLHEFTIGGRRYTMPADDEFYLGEPKAVDETGIRLNSVVTRVGTQFRYAYDFGDDWQVDLLLEAILLPESGVSYPFCVAGARNGPPEDVGGTPGYEDYVAALADPEHDEHEEVLMWRGPFDPEAFDVQAVNGKLAKRSKQRPK